MIEEFTIELNDNSINDDGGGGGGLFSTGNNTCAIADEAAGHAYEYTPRSKSETPTTNSAYHHHCHHPRRNRRTKPRRNNSISTASTAVATSDFDQDTFSDSLSSAADKNSMALSTEVSGDLYFEEIEKLLDDTENADNTTTANTTPTVSIAAKMQARLLARHLKTHRLRRVVSHSAATSLQDDVDMLNGTSGTGPSTSTRHTRAGKMRTVFSFSDMRHHDAEEHQILTDRILRNILEGDDNEEETNVIVAPNAVFEEFAVPSEDNGNIQNQMQMQKQQQQQATLKPHPKMSTTRTTVLNDDNDSSSRVGYIPFFPPPQLGGLRRAKTSAATYTANVDGRIMLASNESPCKSQPEVFGGLPSMPKPKAGQRLLQRSKTDSLAHCGGASSDRNSRKIKEVTVEDFYALIRLHQSQTL